MPQLDKFTFFPVVIWVIVIVFFLYNLILVNGLPKIYKILNYRKKVLEYNGLVRDLLAEEYFYIVKMHNKIFFDYISGIKLGPEKSIITVENSFDVLKEFSHKDENFQKDWLLQKGVCLVKVNKIEINE